ncbi:uncharacterized protein BDR25DRAFT_291245 [Lindgomyces ingoldianus]|uniref:Uncharacterized protein n=1 Tax=Lindgomyces ingoldianus TaxID=673940 RepID=A0ACB6QP13_9PLEO|nr:uncharacterized protein BDR25DRAFT_291245 [Lindgomyces ingoldianus]KAF2467842.1 hypothetical protein BDR25DRAFT_291245 [Lindgomyces ingoldianus]
MDVQQKRHVLFLGLFAVASFAAFMHYASTRGSLFPIGNAPSTSAANATLGFGAVIAVSSAKSPRRNDLLYAANLTGLDITIPEQPTWTDEDVRAFRAKEGSRISKGSAMAWMGHLNALKWFLSTPLTTALILEDDVDWDIRLLSSQIPLAASSIRHLLSNSSTPHPFSPSTSTAYWSDPSTWEILYLGHCGDFLPPSSLATYAHVAYQDSSVPPLSSLYPATSQALGVLGVPESTRLTHRSHSPFCTFGYAVTRASAQRILDSYATEGEGGCQAFDVRILEACRDHGWLCYSISPELFHHVDADSEIENVDFGKGGRGGVKRLNGRTRNIGCRARHPGFYGEEEETVEWLKEVVGRKGQCLVDWMDEDVSAAAAVY